MKTLEECIKQAKLTVESDSNQVTIDRTRFASRKRNRTSTISIAKEQMKDNNNSQHNDSQEINQEIQFWKEKYEKLNEEQNNKENDHQDQLDKSILRYNHLKDYVKLLEENEFQLKEQINKINESNSNNNKILSFFELMTSMTVNSELINNNDIYSCTIKNEINRRATKFDIKLDSEDLIFEPKVNSIMLPDYLRGGITGESRMAPVIMGDILQQLYEEKD